MEFSSNGNVGNKIEKKKKQMGERKNIKKKLQWISKEIHKTYQIVKLIILLLVN